MRNFLKYEKDRWTQQGEKIPAIYGLCYRDFSRDVNVYYVIPLNLIVAAFRWLRYRVAFAWPTQLAKHELHIYRLGQQDGFEKGRYNKEVVRGAAEILRAEGLEARYRE